MVDKYTNIAILENKDKRSKAMVEQIDELHQKIEQLKTEIPPEDNSSSKMDAYRVWSAEKMWHSFLPQA